MHLDWKKSIGAQMKVSTALAVGMALGVGIMYLFCGNTDSNQQLQPKCLSSTVIEGAENIKVINTKSSLSDAMVESTLITPELDNQYSDVSLDKDQLWFTHEEPDIEALKQEMRDSPENVRLRNLWDLNKEVIGWDHIERVAPNLTYEQKLNLESLIRNSPNDGLDMLLFVAKLPNTGNDERNNMYQALNVVSEMTADNVFMMDSLIEDACGQQASPKDLMRFVNRQKDNIVRAYQKRNLSELRRLINDDAVCSGI